MIDAGGRVHALAQPAPSEEGVAPSWLLCQPSMPNAIHSPLRQHYMQEGDAFGNTAAKEEKRDCLEGEGKLLSH